MIPYSMVSVNMNRGVVNPGQMQNVETVKMHFVIVATICCSNKVVTQMLFIQFMNPFMPT